MGPRTAWTGAEAGDQSGRVAFVTGANSGIGLETARHLADLGAHVVLGCRSRPKAEVARREILDSNPRGEVSLVDLDLASLTSVRAAAAEFDERFSRLDLLVNNAGVMATPKRQTADGFELQFGTNHLGHFALTGLLLRSLLATGGSRVVTVSSVAHRVGTLHIDDLSSPRRYHAWRAYGQSKLANLLFTFELQRRLEAAGAGTIAVAAHPGGSSTNLLAGSRGIVGTLAGLASPVTRAVLQSAHMGAMPTLRAALDPSARGGDYFGPGGMFERRGWPVKVDSTARAKDASVAAALWEASQQMTGVGFELLNRAVR